jgi:hypothetical protein
VPEEADAATEMKLIGGRPHRRIELAELAAGDYITFYKDGVRLRRVREVVIGRKRKTVKFDPAKVAVFKTQTCKLEEVLSAWRAAA